MATKSKKKKSILKSRFYQVYFIVVAVMLIAIFFGTIWLKGLLADYESAQPVYVAEEVAQMFEAGDYDALYAVDTSAQQISGGDRAFYTRSMAEIAAGKVVEWSEAFSTDEDVRRYNVTLSGDRFAGFTLVPSGEKTARGNRLWKLGEVTTYVTLSEPEPEPEPEPEATASPEPTQASLPRGDGELYECRITVPSGCAVTVEGVRLSEDNAQIVPGFLFEDGFLPEGVENPMTTQYVFSVDSESPAIEVTDASGAAVTPEAVPDKERAWVCTIPEDAALSAKYSENAYRLGQQIAKFMSKDGSKKSITRLCLKKSPAWTIFDNLSNRYATPHKGIDFRNPQVTEFYRLSDTCFTCHVSFDYVLDTTDGERVYPTAYTFCIYNDNGRTGLYNMLIY